MARLTVMGVHGLGDHRNQPWEEEWRLAIRNVLPRDIELNFVAFSYDDIFEDVDLSFAETSIALGKLLSSGIQSSFGSLASGLGSLFGGSRDLAGAPTARGGISDSLRWTAGYVVAWVEDEGFRTKVRERLLKRIGEVQPDVLLGHSLGSMITYDAITSDLGGFKAAQKHLPKLNYVTLGSQIANPFVQKNLTPGRIVMPGVKHWWHLYNREDAVFTAPIRLPGHQNFWQVDTYFDIDGFADHEATEYLQHSATEASVWHPLAMELSSSRTVVRAAASRMAMQSSEGTRRSRIGAKVFASSEPRRRALLVGINEYKESANNLEGCVNDVFRMSEVLQECQFRAEEIRVVLNQRATAAGIRERLEWLVDGARPGDELVFFYSGHGAQLPTYGLGDSVDRMDETLVPHDFDWSPATSITDDHIYHTYSQLPVETRLAMIFDCCHSGGMHRDGGAKIRGLVAPDDIRHRAMRWSPEDGMWVPREFLPLNDDFSDDADVRKKFMGTSGSVLKLGRAMSLRGQTRKEYDELKKKNKKSSEFAPYLPLIIEACQEAQLSYEYRHGVQSYGAFTYVLTDELRKAETISFENLVKQTGKRLSRLGYNQCPEILGPSKILKANVPWNPSKK